MPKSPAPTRQLTLSQLAPERALRRLELTVVRRLEGFLHGEHLGLLPGPGSDLAEARAYVPGEDDVRRMDWAVTARTTVPHVRDVVADRELETWALVDLSPSMAFGTTFLEKRELAVAAVATIGFMTQQMGDRFGGLVLASGRLRRYPAHSGRNALYALLRALLAQAGDDTAQQPSDLAGALEQLGRGYRRRGLRVVVSDFLGGDNETDPQVAPRWERPMRKLAAQHQVLAIEIVDPRELELPDVGVIRLADPESGQVRELDTRRRSTRLAYAQAAWAQRERTRVALRRCGVAHLTLRTDSDWVNDTVRFVLAHRRIAQRLHQPPRGVSR